MQTNDDTDFQLVEQIQAGSDAAFDELLRRYKRPVVNFAWRILGDAGEADDVAQEVFVAVYQNIGAYEPQTKFSTWLFALARNACIDRIRWRKRHPAEPLDDVREIATPSTVTGEVTAHEIGAEIAAAVAHLPEDQRTAIVLSEYHGLSYAEIAQVMKCSTKSVESRLYRARQTLRVQLKHLLE